MSPERGNYAAGVARREQILEAATLHFVAHGYHGTTLSGIAKDVGITTPGLMHHFGSKEELLVALADHRISLLASWAGEGPRSDDGLDFWRTTIRLTERLVSRPGFIQLFVRVAFEAADPTSPVHELYARRYEEGVRRAEGQWRRGIELSLFRADIDCEAFARQGIAVTDGLQLQWALSDGRLDLVAAVRDHHQRLLRSAALPGVEIDLSPRPARGASRRGRKS